MMRVILFALISLAAATIGADVTCPDNTITIGNRSCLYFRPIGSEEFEGIRKSYDKAAEGCGRLNLGQLKWNLPKVDTVDKRRQIGVQLRSFAGTSRSPIANSDSVRPWFWLGLRRYTDQMYKLPSDESAWYWTSDNTTLSVMETFGEDFWELNQPKNEAENEFCALAVVYLQEYLLFADTFCEEAANTNNGITAEHPPNLIALVCTAEMGLASPGEKGTKASGATDSITDEWWFYALCGLLLAFPFLIAAIILIIYCTLKRRRQRRVSPSSGKYKKQKSHARVKQIGSGSDDRSSSGEQDSDEHPEPHHSRPKVGYVPPPMIQQSKMESTSSDGDGTVYSNILFTKKKSRPKCALKVKKKAIRKKTVTNDFSD